MANVERLEAARERRRRLQESGGDGHDGGMPPDELAQRVARIDARLDSLAPAVEAFGKKLDTLIDKVSGLAERVSSVEGQLKHIPTLWTMILGQIAAAVVVAGIVITAFNYGVTAAAPKTPAAPSPTKAEATPATPLPAPGPTPAAAFTAVKFKSSSAEPTDAAKAELARIAADIKRLGATPKVQLFYGASEKNGGLADARAQAVEKYLNTLGVTAKFSTLKVTDGADAGDQLQLLAVPEK